MRDQAQIVQHEVLHLQAFLHGQRVFIDQVEAFFVGGKRDKIIRPLADPVVFLWQMERLFHREPIAAEPAERVAFQEQ